MSSSKKVLFPLTIIGSDARWGNSGVSGVMSGTNTITSNAINIQNIDNVCMEIAWTGTPTGSFAVEGSLTQENWSAIDLSIAGAAGQAGSRLLDMNQLSFPFIRLVYTNSSGSGALTAYIGGKEV
jgi:hypothetical protein